MPSISRFLLVLVLLSLLAACAPVSAGGAVVAPSQSEGRSGLANAGQQVLAAVNIFPQAQNGPTPAYTLVVAPPNATATPTPFRPLAPTAFYLPSSTPTATSSPTPLPTATSTPVPRQGNGRFSLSQPPNQINILLLGSDRRPWQVNFRTDTIILVTVNPDLGTVNMTSFPRDLFVNVPGYGNRRINTAFYLGGYELLAKTMDQNFGVYPDHYVLVNFSIFKKFVDSLGGLTVNVGKSLTDYRYPKGYITIPAGSVEMNADDVLWYVRSRKTTNDFDRARRQQEVLRAIFDKMITLDGIKRFPEYYNLYKDNVTTDLSLGDLITLAPVAAKVADDRERLNTYIIGPKQTYDMITWDGAMVLVPVEAEIRKVLQKSLNIP